MTLYYKHNSKVRPDETKRTFAVVPAPGHCGSRVEIVGIYDNFDSAMKALRKRNDRCVVPVSGYDVGDNIGPWQSHDRMADFAV